MRAGVVRVIDGQRTAQAQAQLVELGVRDIGLDGVRGVGRGAGQAPEPSQLCGRCGSGVIAISPDGVVWPCVFSRWLSVGNVLDDDLATIVNGPAMTDVRARLDDEFRRRMPVMRCVPDMRDPQCGPSCSPACRPAGNCRPAGGCIPWY